ncbi:MAG: type II secretion system F family protein, partial [Thermoplasmata archaeon]|nr:type II secretion system F family protein [Thermoplasmata archaeon]
LDRDVFPIISEEAAAVYRDMQILGIDTLTAIQHAVDRAPSPWLAEFFQGISSTLSSGGNLKLYFLNSAERFMEDIKQDQKQLLEQLAIQAEMFVTVAVAMPIFLIIILIITVWISSGTQTGNSMSTLYLVIFAFVPLLHFFFATMTYLNIKKFSV